MLDEIVTFSPLFHHHDCFLQFHLFLSRFPSRHQPVSFVHQLCFFCFSHGRAELRMSFICLIFILDAYANHWSMQLWILCVSYCAGICHLVGSERWASWGSACLSYCSYAGCQLKCLNLSSASVFCNYIGWLWMAHLQCGGPLLIYASGRCH